MLLLNYNGVKIAFEVIILSSKPNKEKESDKMLNVRIKEIRKELGLSQKDFSEPLPITRSHYAGIESGLKNLTDRLINEVCTEYGVNKNWFITGEGSKFLDPLKDFQLNEEVEELLRLYLEVDEETKEYVKGLMRKTLHTHK